MYYSKVNIKYIIHTVSNFLFSKANREFLIFLFFFAVAGVFWLLMALNETYEQELRIPVRYVNIPKMAVLTSEETDTVRVTVSDKGYVLTAYLYGDALHEIQADFKKYASKSNRGIVPTSDLYKMLSSRLAASSKIISVKPDHLSFYYNYGEKKMVPVHWRGAVTPEDLHFISDVQYQPDSVTIYASREKLDSINVIYTETLNYNEIHDTLVVDAQLRKMAGVKIVPEVVRITFLTDVLTEENIEGIPIVGINMPEGKVLRTFPARVGVKFVTGVNTYRRLSPNDFMVVADYNELRQNPAPKCNIYLQEVPDGISRAVLDVKQVDYLIEEQSR